MTSDLTDRQRLANLTEALVADILATPDDEILAEAEEDGFVEPESCPACNGTGWIAGGEDDDDDVACPLCGGTGEDR